MDTRERIRQLTETLTEANYRYYVLDDPRMPDFEYDALLRELEELEKAHPEQVLPDSPTQRVGGQALSQFEKMTHEVPLQSLQDVFSMEELRDFLHRTKELVPDASFSVEPKIDGLSVALEYVDGRFVRGATRGDGVVVAKEATDSFTEEDYLSGLAYLKMCYGADAYTNAELVEMF